MLKCIVLTIYYTLRYPQYGLFRGQYLSGHDYEFTGEIHFDHWEMKCTQCGQTAGSEVGPEVAPEEMK